MTEPAVKDKILEQVLRGLPYSSKIRNIDTQRETNAIRFDWSGMRLRVTDNLMVSLIEDGLETTNTCSMLIHHLLLCEARAAAAEA